MLDVREKPDFVERAVLVSVYKNRSEEGEQVAFLNELAELVSTLGVDIVGKKLLRIPSFHARLLVGTGNAEAILDYAKQCGADCLVFDNELSPAQQRNWESLSKKLCVVDRQEVILDIFARRAQTKEAKLQVGLARMEFSLPRLKRAWTHLGRQGGGGSGAGRGEGEQQIEVDRRMVRKKIDQLKSELKDVRKIRATQRNQRQRKPIPNAAIVGYTNAGKSSLLCKLTGADVLVADKLFATLDTTTRKVELPNGHPLLLTDTVGFVRKLPHRLVESFKATLEEAVLAEFLVHVLDCSQPSAEAFYQTTMDVLKELGADEKRIITVFNKVDLVEDQSSVAALHQRHPDAIFASVHTGQGMDEVLQRMADMLASQTAHVDLELPYDRNDLLAVLHEHGRVLSCEYEDHAIVVQASIPNRLETQFKAYEKNGTVVQS